MPEYFELEEDGGSNKYDTCFICLEDSSQGKLRRCCSQCYALVHRKCWSKWNISQQIALLRGILLGEQVRETHVCSICRSGSVQIEYGEGSDDEFEEDNKSLSSNLLWSFFRILISRAYGTPYGSFFASTSEHPASSLRTLLINGIFVSLLFIYIFYRDGHPDSKSIITISLWAYITLVLQFLILTGIHRRQVLEQLAIEEPDLADNYETIGINDAG
ncbi:RING finger domain-containing protein [Cryptosporidium felis]|nr:RING finger domain-containing protein [Cryptosporidium felis]